MKTIILMWNPAISSYKMEQFEEELSDLYDGYITDYNWSIYEFDKVSHGDRFYMVRCGHGHTGIVMSGKLIGEPYTDEDWSGRKRKVYYMDMEPDYFVHTEKVGSYLSTDFLMKELPGFDWTGGHAGRVLSDSLAEKLETLWDSYTEELHKQGCIDGERAAYMDWDE